jgi:hypothetical protein
MCAPRWDSDAVFSTLIGGGGCYLVAPDEQRFVWGGHYEDGSLIWRSRWVTGSGVIECREALALPGEDLLAGADEHTAVLLRRVITREGPARVRVVLDPRADFGRSPLRQIERDGAHWTGRCGSLHLRWSGAEHARERDGRLECVLELPEGTEHDLVLQVATTRLGDHRVEADPAWEATETGWRRAVPRLGTVIGRRDARHAYAVLRGLTSSSGGMVAAVTTSLPERAGAGRNYDYRYVWIRDPCFAGQAVAADGAHPLLDDAVSFVADRVLADGARLRPAYRVDGGPVPPERSLPQLAGYPGGSDRVGNWVGEKFQLDAFGEALLLFAAAARHDLHHWRAAAACVAAIEQRWRDPDRRLGRARGPVGALPAHLRRRAALDRAGCARRAGGVVDNAGGQGARRCGRRVRPSHRTLAAFPDRRPGRRRAAAARHPGRHPGGRSAPPGHGGRGARRADRGRFRPPVPP